MTAHDIPSEHETMADADNGPLAGRHALVTGGGRGIGLAVAKTLAAQGVRLTLVARSVDQLEEARAACREAGARHVNAAPCNLTDRHQLERLCRGAAADVEILVNNAGSAPSAPFERTDDVVWDKTFALNTFAPFMLARAVLPGMVERGFGRVINVASTAGLEGYAYTSAYCASKHALVGLTRALSAELDARSPGADVSINAVCPGFVDTDIVALSARRIATATGCSEEEARERLGAMNAGGHLLTPGDVAARVVALAVEAPAATRGACLEWDGGHP